MSQSMHFHGEGVTLHKIQDTQNHYSKLRMQIGHRSLLYFIRTLAKIIYTNSIQFKALFSLCNDNGKHKQAVVDPEILVRGGGGGGGDFLKRGPVHCFK